MSHAAVNAGAGKELLFGDAQLKPAETPRKVLVIGGGPAGLEAARVAALAAWARRKFKRLRRRKRASVHWLGGIARREPALFAHWRFGATPAAESGRAG